MELTVGMKGRAEAVVTEQNTAQAAGSGTLAVFGTPYMIALMEQAAWSTLAPVLEAGQSSVGTLLNVSHVSASPVGIKVWAECEITAMAGRTITFSVAAYDEAGLIGQGTHQRAIITDQRFLDKCRKKLEVR